MSTKPASGRACAVVAVRPTNMKRKGMTLAQTVAWIAINDDPSCLREADVAGYISTLLAADIFGYKPRGVARMIVKYRMDMCAKCETVHKYDECC